MQKIELDREQLKLKARQTSTQLETAEKQNDTKDAKLTALTEEVEQLHSKMKECQAGYTKSVQDMNDKREKDLAELHVQASQMRTEQQVK